MKVKELIKTLQSLDQDAEVILSKDSEGNNYSPLSDMKYSVYIPECTWSGEVKMRQEDLTDELISCGYSEEDCYNPEYENGIDAVVFYPIN